MQELLFFEEWLHELSYGPLLIAEVAELTYLSTDAAKVLKDLQCAWGHNSGKITFSICVFFNVSRKAFRENTITGYSFLENVVDWRTVHIV